MVQTSGEDSSRKFRLNPLEAVIFAAVFGVFGASVYRLFNDGEGSATAALSLRPTAERMREDRMKAAYAKNAAEAPSDAASAQDFEASIAALTVNCHDSKSVETTADRVRLSGTFCSGSNRGPASAEESAADRYEGSRTVIVNRANAFTATLFEIPASGEFLTDFIPLEPGENRLVFDFHFKSGKTVSFERTLIRKPASTNQ